jgi:glycerate dehydrogenase
MKIVYLDGYTLNHGDLDWSALLALGDVKIYDRTSPTEIIERTKDADMILTNKCPVNRLTINELPKLKYIGVTATGYNIVDVQAAKERGITVTNVRGYSTDSVAQHTFSLILAITNRLIEHIPDVAETWASQPDFCYYRTPLRELSGKTLGIVGLGDIGKKTTEIALAFGMKVIATRRDFTKEKPENIELLSLEELLKNSDFVSLHCPQTLDNQGFMNKKALSMMKPTAYLINTSRGGLINENDLANCLNEGKIAGAGLDVLTTEPPEKNNPLLTARNCLITPHQAWASLEARERLLKMVIENIQAFQAGKLQNVVS